MKYFISKIILLITFSLGFGQNQTIFKQANTLYNEGKYERAIKKYEQILSSKKHSAALYFNLANAHYKLNHIAPSIYYYEKALLLKPEDKDINNNIVFARNMTIDAIETVPEVGLKRFFNNLIKAFSFDTWAWLSIVSICIFVALIITYRVSYTTSVKKLSFIASFLFLMSSLCCLIFAFQNQKLFDNSNPAIVFAKTSEIKSEPNLRSNKAFELHEGTKVNVLEEVDNWKKIELSDKNTGWILADDIKLIKNF